MSATMSLTTTVTEVDLKEWVKVKNYDQIATFLTNFLAGGSKEDARDLLEHVLDTFPGGDTSARKRSAEAGNKQGQQDYRRMKVDESNPPNSLCPFLEKDVLDEAIVTGLFQIPNNTAIIGAIIGPRGQSIKNIADSSGCVVNIDQKSQSVQNKNAPVTVFLQGSVESLIKAAQLISTKVEKVSAGHEDSLPSNSWGTPGGIVDRSVILIPNALVKRIIGRKGATVVEMQKESGATIQLQTEQMMFSAPDPIYGREAIITGSLSNRLHAMYLIYRLLLQDKEFPLAWRTSLQFPLPLRQTNSATTVMTVNGVHFAPTPPAPPLVPPPQHQVYTYHPQILGPAKSVATTGAIATHTYPSLRPPQPSSSQLVAAAANRIGQGLQSQSQQNTQPPNMNYQGYNSYQTSNSHSMRK